MLRLQPRAHRLRHRAGALADLLVVEGDPTADITVLQEAERRRAVIKDGSFQYVNPEVYP